MSHALSYHELSLPVKALLFYGVSVRTGRAQPLSCESGGVPARPDYNKVRRFKKCSMCRNDFETERIDEDVCYSCQVDKIQTRVKAEYKSKAVRHE